MDNKLRHGAFREDHCNLVFAIQWQLIYDLCVNSEQNWNVEAICVAINPDLKTYVG